MLGYHMSDVRTDSYIGLGVFAAIAIGLLMVELPSLWIAAVSLFTAAGLWLFFWLVLRYFQDD